TFYTGNNHIFYLELAMDHMEFVKIKDFEPQEKPDPDALMALAGQDSRATKTLAAGRAQSETDDLLQSLGL
ncbi:MAG: DUF3334 family protein, partial [Comamonas sp.]